MTAHDLQSTYLCLKLAPEMVRPTPVERPVQVWIVVPVPGPMSPPTAPESIPHFSVSLVGGVAQEFVVPATVAVKSRALLVIVNDVVVAVAE